MQAAVQSVQLLLLCGMFGIAAANLLLLKRIRRENAVRYRAAVEDLEIAQRLLQHDAEGPELPLPRRSPPGPIWTEAPRPPQA